MGIIKEKKKLVLDKVNNKLANIRVKAKTSLLNLKDKKKVFGEKVNREKERPNLKAEAYFIGLGAVLAIFGITVLGSALPVKAADYPPQGADYPPQGAPYPPQRAPYPPQNEVNKTLSATFCAAAARHAPYIIIGVASGFIIASTIREVVSIVGAIPE